MAEKLEVKILTREVVKPSRPTPPHLRRFNLSLVDQMAEHSLVPFLYLYSPNGNTLSFAEKCRHLKSSLSQTLSLFYPLAGRIRDNCSMDCCDDGAEFVVAGLNCTMTHFSGSPDPDLLRLLVPVNINPTDIVAINMKIKFLCIVQATLLECGGVAICVCLSHKICDGVTYMSFIQTWAAIATESDVESPDLSLASLLPPNPTLESPSYSNEAMISGCKNYKTLTRKLFFSASKLEELKLRASSSVVEKPTRVEAVMGLISKCAVSAAASTAANSSSQHSAVWVVAANLRERLAPLVPKNTVGNLLGLVVVPTPITKDLSILNQVIALRRAKDVFNESFEGIGTAKDIKPFIWFQAGNEILSKVDMDRVYTITSICGLPNYFDFGWGKPKVVIPIMLIRNVVVMMDGGEDLRGVQAYVTLEEQEMSFFEHDHHLLSFASISPSLSINYVYDGKSGHKPKL